MTDLIQVSKSEGTKSYLDVVGEFQNSTSVDEIKNAVYTCKDRVYASWASVDVRDKDGEAIPIGDVIAQQDVLLKRGGPITDEHSNAVVGRTLAYKVLTHPETKRLGVVHLNLIYNDNPLDDKVWEETRTGKRTGSSVGGFTDQAKRVEMKDGRPTEILEGFHQLETASVHSPANPLAMNIAVSQVAKSEKKKGEFLAMIEGEVVKFHFEKLGQLQNQSEVLGVPKLKKTENEETTIKTEGDTMTNDVLKTAMEKLEKGEILSADEKTALKNAVKAENDEKEKPKDEKPKEEEKKKSEDLTSGKESPKSPETQDANELDVVKSQMANLMEIQKQQNKLLEQLVNKNVEPVAKKSGETIEAPKPFNPVNHKMVAKAEQLHSVAKSIALGQPVMLNGVQKRMNWAEANRLYKEALTEIN